MPVQGPDFRALCMLGPCCIKGSFGEGCARQIHSRRPLSGLLLAAGLESRVAQFIAQLLVEKPA